MYLRFFFKWLPNQDVLFPEDSFPVDVGQIVCSFDGFFSPNFDVFI